jgi:hypothetical protein
VSETSARRLLSGVAAVLLFVGVSLVVAHPGPASTVLLGPASPARAAAPGPRPPPPAGSVPSQPAVPATFVLPYEVVIRSDDPGLVGAAEQITAVLEDPRGWQQAGIDFQRRADAPYAILLAEGDDAQALCQPYDVGERFSCQNGPLVVLNAIRWREGVEHWPGDLDSYRTMLVNHEVGHLLGMHHIRCRTPGATAPVMEQQSGSLGGCQANSWPTAIELRLAATHQFELAPGPSDASTGG